MFICSICKENKVETEGDICETCFQTDDFLENVDELDIEDVGTLTEEIDSDD